MHWITASGTLDKPTLVVLADSMLYVVDGEQSMIALFKEEIDAGTPASVLLQRGKTIPLEKVTHITADEKRKSITIKWHSRSLSSNHGYDQESIDFSVASDRDALFYTLKDIFGDESQFTRKEFSRLRATLAPLTGGIVIVGIAWFIIYASSHLEETVRNPHRLSHVIFIAILTALVAILGKAGVKIVVSIITLLLLYFVGRDLGERVKNPPIMLTLKIKSGWKPAAK